MDALTLPQPPIEESLAARPTLDFGPVGAILGTQDTIDLPAGVYYLGDDEFPIYRNVPTVGGQTINGAGTDATILVFGNGRTPSSPQNGDSGLKIDANCTVRNLTIVNLSESYTKNNLLRIGVGNSLRDVTLENVRIVDRGRVQSPRTGNLVHSLTLLNCDFETEEAPTFENVRNLRVLGGSYRWNGQRFRMINCPGFVVRGASFRWDTTRWKHLVDNQGLPEPDRESGCFETTFSHGGVIEASRIVTAGPYETVRSAEGPATQIAGIAAYNAVFRVAEVHGRSIKVKAYEGGPSQDTQPANWGGDDWCNVFVHEGKTHMLSVLTGYARGQSRWAAKQGTDTIGILDDAPSWAGTGLQEDDLVSLSVATSVDQAVQDCFIEGYNTAASLYDGAFRFRFRRNHCLNTGALLMRSATIVEGRTPNSGVSHLPVWDCEILDNVFVGDNGRRLTGISAYSPSQAYYDVPRNFSGNRVWRNVIHGQDMANGVEAPSHDGIDLFVHSYNNGTVGTERIGGIDLGSGANANVVDGNVIGGRPYNGWRTGYPGPTVTPTF